MYSYLCHHGLRARERERDRSSYNRGKEEAFGVTRIRHSFLTAKAPRARPLLHSSRIVKVMAPKLVDGVRSFLSLLLFFSTAIAFCSMMPVVV